MHVSSSAKQVDDKMHSMAQKRLKSMNGVTKSLP
jgi:hypothetical protein